MSTYDNWYNKRKGARHIMETYGMTFSAWNHAFCWMQNDMTMIKNTSSYTKRRISKDVLCFPYLPSKVLCIRWTLHEVLIFYHTLGSLVCLSFSSSPWESSNMSSFFMTLETHNCVVSLGSDYCKMRPWKDTFVLFQDPRQTRQLRDKTVHF